MERSKLKIYRVGFTPIHANGRIGVSSNVLVIAYSEDQAKKLLRDWMVIRRKQNYFYEGVEKINKTSPEGKQALGNRWKSYEERFEAQNNYIYKGEKL